MKPTIKLFFDFEFTSLSPDGQPISLGIVSEEINRLSESDQFHKFALFGDDKVVTDSREFYSEFNLSLNEINQCDDWVKENVISKLYLNRVGIPEGTGKYECLQMDLSKDGKIQFYYLFQKKWEKGDHPRLVQFDPSPKVYGSFEAIKEPLNIWLKQFSGFDIQFVCDCGTWDWYWMIQLIGEWEWYIPYTIDEVISKHKNKEKIISSSRTGLPKLPANISPVPMDLNDLIASKLGISIRKAFDLNREELSVIRGATLADELIGTCAMLNTSNPKHNALWDAKVIKALYEKLQ